MYVHYLIRTSAAPEGGFAPGFPRYLASTGLFAPVAPIVTAPASLSVFGLLAADVAVSVDDGGYAVPVSVTLSAAHGTVAVTMSDGVAITAGSIGSSLLGLTGMAEAMNVVLATLRYTSVVSEGTDSISIAAVNGVGRMASTVVPISIALMPVPTVSLPAFLEAITEQPTPIAGVLVGMADMVRIAVSAGTLTVGLNDRVTMIAGGNGTAMVHLSGDQSALHDVVRSLVYRSVAGFVGVDTLAVTAEHQVGTDASGAVPLIVQPETAVEEPDDMLRRILENTGRLYGG